MALKVEVKFLEQDKFEVISLKSGAKTYIDSRRENYTPQAPNSSELFLASLGGCILYYAKKYLLDIGISFQKLLVRVSGEWKRLPFQITNIKVSIFTDAYLGERKKSFLRFVRNCPVHNTIMNTEEITILVNEDQDK